jgi:hypothetical protein
LNGFHVKPDYLDDAAKKFDGLGNSVGGAEDQLSANGDLPTLDPLSKAMAAAALVAGGSFLGPVLAVGGYFGGKAISGAMDPYPGVRSAWLTALPRYERLLARDAHELRESAETYRGKERKGRKRFEGIEPMPRVPGAPTSPMPRVPGAPAVPMPTPGPGPHHYGPI